jgi:hypothetical protein
VAEPTYKGPFWHDRDQHPGPPAQDKQYSYLFQHALEEVSYKDGYGLALRKDKTDPDGRWYFQVECKRPDSATGEITIGKGGKAYLSPHMNKSELIRLIFGLFRAYEEHECREFFHWRGRAVFGPHIDIESLWVAAEDLDYRT